MNPVPGARSPEAGPPMAGVDTCPRTRALQRLAASRHGLELAWLPVGSARHGRAPGARNSQVAGLWKAWRPRLIGIPVLGIALGAAEQWWADNPWRLAGQAMADEIDEALTPWARRHPLLTVALAAGAGCAVVAARPWAWPGVSGHLRLLPGRIGRWALAQITLAPLLAGLAEAKLATERASENRAPASESAREPAAGVKGVSPVDIPHPIGD